MSIGPPGIPVGRPWFSCRTVWVYATFANRAGGVYAVAKLPPGIVPGEREMQALYADWVRTRVTIPAERAAATCLAVALEEPFDPPF